MVIPKIHKGWKELNEEIIQTGICVYCGACGAFCGNISFDLTLEIPIEDGSCTEQSTCRDGFGTCYNLCPKTGLEYISTKLLNQWTFGAEAPKENFGHILEVCSARFAGDRAGVT